MGPGERARTLADVRAEALAPEGLNAFKFSGFAGVVGGYSFARVAASYLGSVHMPGALPILGAATVNVGEPIIASLMPAALASRVDVLQALRSE